VVNNPAPCLSDTSELVINLAASVSAGNDISDFFCENATLDLNSYLSSGASAGGKFFLNGVEIINAIIRQILKPTFSLFTKLVMV
jgi:hypothetical protein